MSEFQSSFNTNYTLPTTPYHFMASGNSRDTLRILWTPLSALSLCTWRIQHLAIPAQKNPEDTVKEGSNYSFWNGSKNLYMLATLITPEVLIGMALVNWISTSLDKVVTLQSKISC